MEINLSQCYVDKNDALFTYGSKLLCAPEIGFAYNTMPKQNQKVMRLDQVLQSSSQYERVITFYQLKVTRTSYLYSVGLINCCIVSFNRF